MNVLTIINLVLAILQGVLGQLKPNPALATIVTAIESAISNLQEVQNDPVTKVQIDSLRVDQLW